MSWPDGSRREEGVSDDRPVIKKYSHVFFHDFVIVLVIDKYKLMG